MSWYSRRLTDTLTYWAPPRINEWGDQTYPSPATLKAFWKDAVQQYATPDGVLRTTSAVVHVERLVEPNGFLYLGISSAASPRLVPGSARIERVDRLPTLRRDLTVYVAFV